MQSEDTKNLENPGNIFGSFVRNSYLALLNLKDVTTAKIIKIESNNERENKRDGENYSTKFSHDCKTFNTQARIVAITENCANEYDKNITSEVSPFKHDAELSIKEFQHLKEKLQIQTDINFSLTESLKQTKRDFGLEKETMKQSNLKDTLAFEDKIDLLQRGIQNLTRKNIIQSEEKVTLESRLNKEILTLKRNLESNLIHEQYHTQNIKQQLNIAEEKNKYLESNLDIYAQEKSSWAKEKAEYDIEIKGLNENAVSDCKKIEKLAENIHKLETELHNLTAKFARIKKKAEKYCEANVYLEKRMGELETINQKLANCSIENENLQNNLFASKCENVQLLQKLKDLESTLNHKINENKKDKKEMSIIILELRAAKKKRAKEIELLTNKEVCLENSLKEQEKVQKGKIEELTTAYDAKIKNSQDTFNACFECSVCTDIFDDATTTNCGHTFCRKCIEKCLERKQPCPLCRSVVNHISSNACLNGYIENFISPTFISLATPKLKLDYA